MTGDRPGDVFRQFRDHVSGLLNKTITDAPLSLTSPKDKPYANFSFRDENTVAMAAPLFGANLYLAVSQALEANQLADRTWRLKTLRYNYHLLEGPKHDSKWIIRWEYISHSQRKDLHPRHHVHIATTVKTPVGEMDFDQLHLSTGWVTIEEVIRFMIVEMGVKPKSDNWDEELLESEDLFKQWTKRDI